MERIYLCKIESLDLHCKQAQYVQKKCVALLLLGHFFKPEANEKHHGLIFRFAVGQKTPANRFR